MLRLFHGLERVARDAHQHQHREANIRSPPAEGMTTISRDLRWIRNFHLLLDLFVICLICFSVLYNMTSLIAFLDIR